MSVEFEIFTGKKLSSLFKDIYNNSINNKKQLNILLEDLSKFITNTDSAIRLVPVIKDYLEINVKNDDQLVKLASIVQKLINGKDRIENKDSNFILTDKEKTQLLKTFESSISDIQNETKKIQTELNSIPTLD